MKLNRYIYACTLGLSFLLLACEKETKEALDSYPEDITFNELALDRFSFSFADDKTSGSDKAGFVSFSGQRTSDRDFEGFALSNKNYRSFPWSLSYTFGNPAQTGAALVQAIDSTLFSVFTNVPNRTENYLVGNAGSGKAILRFKKASTLAHILVANTTYTYLQTVYGSVFSGTLDPAKQAYLATGTKVRNPLNPNTATTMYGTFYLPGPSGQNLIRLDGYVLLQKEKAGNLAKEAALTAGKSPEAAQAAYEKAKLDLKMGQVKLLIHGYLNGNKVGEVSHFLAVRAGVDGNNLTYNYTQNNWLAVDLNALGNVDELRFTMDGDYKDAAGKLLTPAYFCVDGIRLKK